MTPGRARQLPWKNHLNRRSLLLLLARGNTDLAAGGLEDRPCDGQAHARLTLARESSIEDMVPVSLGDALAVVSYTDQDPASIRLQDDRDGSPSLAGLDGIFDDDE